MFTMILTYFKTLEYKCRLSENRGIFFHILLGIQNGSNECTLFDWMFKYNQQSVKKQGVTARWKLRVQYYISVSKKPRQIYAYT